MNVGYTKNLNSEVDNENCPICGSNIYISKYYNDYACIDQNCLLGHGARKLIEDVSKILDMLKNKPKDCGYSGKCESEDGCKSYCSCKNCKGNCEEC